MLTLKNVFYKVVKMCNGFHHCVPLVETVKKTYMERLIQSSDEGVMPPERYSTVGTFDGRDFRPMSGLPTYVGTSDGQDY
jgi:hypothetical protein